MARIAALIGAESLGQAASTGATSAFSVTCAARTFLGCRNSFFSQLLSWGRIHVANVNVVPYRPAQLVTELVSRHVVVTCYQLLSDLPTACKS
jgi:hypothetical protein